MDGSFTWLVLRASFRGVMVSAVVSAAVVSAAVVSAAVVSAVVTESGRRPPAVDLTFTGSPLGKQ